MGDIVDFAVEKGLKKGFKYALKNLPEEAANTILKHSLVAGGAGLIPIPGVDMAILIPNLWAMYYYISRTLGVPMQKHVIKTVAGGIFTNIVVSVGVTKAVGALSKFIPVVGTIAGMAIDSVANFVITYVSGAVFAVLLDVYRTKMCDPKNSS